MASIYHLIISIKQAFQDLSQWFIKHYNKCLNFDYECFRQNKFSWKKIPLIFFHSFIDHEATTKASALTFLTFTSTIPFLALMLCVLQGFINSDIIITALTGMFPYMEKAITDVFNLAGGYIKESSWTGNVIVLGVMLWCTYSLFYSMNHNLNQIWGAKDRTIIDRLRFYIIVLVIVGVALPVLLPVLNYIHHPFAIKIVLYCLAFFAFLCVFKFFPHTNVSFASAATSAIFFMLLLWGLNTIYMKLFDTIEGSYLKNYGSTFAIIFITMAWVHFMWIIFLLSASMGSSIDRQGNYTFVKEVKELSPQYTHFLMVTIASIIYKKWHIEKTETQPDEIVKKLNIPYPLFQNITNQLVAAKIIKPHEEAENKIYHSWIIARKEDYTIHDLLNDVDNHGIDHLLAFDYKQDIKSDNKPLWEEFHAAYQNFYNSSLNTKLYDIEVDA
ncbi:MAG: YihY/virulence factor BrkB family protein [Paludibacteraceae bacterium]|nr:YihY/virulence factor BrkB family protein [Paludibacteraceae bacterium]